MEMMYFDGKIYLSIVYYEFFDAVMEMRAGREIGWVDPEKFAEVYLAGRAK